MNPEKPTIHKNITETTTRYITAKNKQSTQKYNIEFTWFKGTVYVRNLTLHKNLGEYEIRTHDEFDRLVDSYKGYY